MDKRLELSEKLRAILGTSNVYFQPPSNTTMEYPCFVYKLDKISALYADNKVYMKKDRYQVTYITFDPDDTKAADMLSKCKHCEFDRSYTAGNLHHFVYILYV